MSARPYNPKRNLWLQPWNKLLQQVPWTGSDFGFTALHPAADSVEVEPVAVPVTSVIPMDFPTKPMIVGFSKLLGTIPWQGSSPLAFRTNRMKEVLV